MKKTAVTLSFFLTAFTAALFLARAVEAGELTGTIRFEDRTYARSGFTGYEFKGIKCARVTVEYGDNTYEASTRSTSPTTARRKSSSPFTRNRRIPVRTETFTSRRWTVRRCTRPP